MPYQGGYVPEYDDYGNYIGRGFPGNVQPQQRQMYGQQMGAVAGSLPPQQPTFPFAGQGQPSLYGQPQYPQYQQQFQHFNPYQQLPLNHQPSHHGSTRQTSLTPGTYQQNVHQPQQRAQMATQYQNQISPALSLPDSLQQYRPSPQQSQYTGQQPQQQTSHRSQVQSHASTSGPHGSASSPQLVQEPAGPPQQVKQSTVYASETSRTPQPSSSYQRNSLGVKPSISQPVRPTPKQYPQLSPEQRRAQGPDHRLQQNIRQVGQQQRPRLTQNEQQQAPIWKAPSDQDTIQPSVLQRKATHVEIPVVQMPEIEKSETARALKRRKSNEGDTIQVRHHTPTHLKAPGTQLPSSSPLSELQSSQFHPTQVLPPNIDNQAALLALSDQYINAAFTMSASIASMEISEGELHHYHDLLASGLGCLEAVLKNYRIPDARREAQIRLRFASLLCEETDNNDTAEEVLVKGITVCERARLTDLKYAMHHVLARVCFGGDKSKAALRNLDKLISEVEKLNLVHWIYAFRFLRVSLGLQMGNSHAESTTLSKQLTAISNLASSRSHIAVHIVAHSLEALIHLRSQAPDSVDSAQRAIAAARTHQLSSEMESLPQVKILLDCIDLSCSLMRFNPEHAAAKLQTMHADLDGQAKSASWNKGGGWLLPLGFSTNTSRSIEADTCGIMKTTADGQPALTFQWLPKSRIYMLGFLLSGLASLHKSTSSDRKAEMFFKEGLMFTNGPPKGTLRSMTAASEEVNGQQVMRIILLLYVAFGYCVRSDWSKASKAVVAIRKEMEKVESVQDTTISMLLTYLDAVSKHGHGDLVGALELYRSQALTLPEETTKTNSAVTDPLRVLSSLNCILILRRPDKLGTYDKMCDPAESDRLLSRLEPMCATQVTGNGVEYSNQSLKAAFNILRATSVAGTAGQSTIIRTKQYLTTAVHAAKSVADNRLMCMVMNIMTQLFFTSMVGEQAEKSARTSRNLAEKSQDHLWTAVANGMFGDTMERSGKIDEASTARATAQRSVKALPGTLRAALNLEDLTRASKYER